MDVRVLGGIGPLVLAIQPVDKGLFVFRVGHAVLVVHVFQERVVSTLHLLIVRFIQRHVVVVVVDVLVAHLVLVLLAGGVFFVFVVVFGARHPNKLHRLLEFSVLFHTAAVVVQVQRDHFSGAFELVEVVKHGLEDLEVLSGGHLNCRRIIVLQTRRRGRIDTLYKVGIFLRVL